MSQLVYSPFSALNQLHRELGRVFDDRSLFPGEAGNYESSAWVPQVDIKEDDTGFTVVADVPGVNPDDVEVTVDRNVLSIRGHRKTESETGEDGFKRRERISGSFLRQFTLPESADGGAISAKATHGVLHIRIPKGEKNKPLSITVES
ncbi:MAG: Hsp20/alpha crystallin family protein [Pseudomonadales bacterium]|nr:Hsp20/alpha crystallin family protein [Pseudomonadales bacterium]